MAKETYMASAALDATNTMAQAISAGIYSEAECKQIFDFCQGELDAPLKAPDSPKTPPEETPNGQP